VEGSVEDRRLWKAERHIGRCRRSVPVCAVGQVTRLLDFNTATGGRPTFRTTEPPYLTVGWKRTNGFQITGAGTWAAVPYPKLPLVGAGSPAAREKTGAETLDRQQILIVDDHRSLRTAVKMALDKGWYDVLTAASGAHAL
jgi:hypothetical protein